LIRLWRPNLARLEAKEKNSNEKRHKRSFNTLWKLIRIREAINAVFLAITDSLAREEKVTLVGFGTFQVRGRRARRGRNPQTGKELQIPAKKVPSLDQRRV